MRALTRRGVRAIELFGREDSRRDAVEAEPPARTSSTDTDVPGCLLPAGFARAVGFTDVAPHHRYPRLRFELGRDIGWKAEVEAALEKLFTVITVPASPSPAGAGAGRRRTKRTAWPARRTPAVHQAESRMVRSWASRSENVNVPVCGSSRPSRYSRLTATSRPSASRLRKSSDSSRSRSAGFDR